MRSFSSAFKETLYRFHLSGSDLAEKSGLTPAQISQFRNGKNLRIDSVEKILAALPEEARRYMLAWILSDEPETLPPIPQISEFPGTNTEGE